MGWLLEPSECNESMLSVILMLGGIPYSSGVPSWWRTCGCGWLQESRWREWVSVEMSVSWTWDLMEVSRPKAVVVPFVVVVRLRHFFSNVVFSISYWPWFLDYVYGRIVRIFKLNVFGNGLVLAWAGYYWDCYHFDFDIAHTMIGSMKCPCRGLMPVLALNPDWSILNHSCVTRTSHVWRIVGYRIDISVLLVCDELISQLNTRQLGRDKRTKHFSAHGDTVRWISHWWIMTLLVQQYPAGVW